MEKNPMSENADLKRTSLYDIHLRYGARMVPFGGWDMPVQYSGIIDEHQSVRSHAGLFDVSHMGEIWIEGEKALESIQYLTINDASSLYPGRVQYSAMANFEGGMVDDITVYRFADDLFMFCVNASNIEKDFQWIEAHLERFPGVKAVNKSNETALLALQGPSAGKILGRLTYAEIDNLSYYHFLKGKVAGIDSVISRTGYTGEDGFEIYIPGDRGGDLWEELMAAGESEGLKPCGLGARDTLRLEMGYNLYGQDIDETTNPLEARLAWITKKGKGDFIGREAVEKLRNEGIKVSLCGFMTEERGIPRHGYPIIYQGNTVGRVTSGTISPSLRIGIGLAYLPIEAAAPGTGISVRIRDKDIAASVVRLPFYKSASGGKKIFTKKETR